VYSTTLLFLPPLWRPSSLLPRRWPTHSGLSALTPCQELARGPPPFNYMAGPCLSPPSCTTLEPAMIFLVTLECIQWKGAPATLGLTPPYTVTSLTQFSHIGNDLAGFPVRSPLPRLLMTGHIFYARFFFFFQFLEGFESPVIFFFLSSPGLDSSTSLSTLFCLRTALPAPLFPPFFDSCLNSFPFFPRPFLSFFRARAEYDG